MGGWAGRYFTLVATKIMAEMVRILTLLDSYNFYHEYPFRELSVTGKQRHVNRDSHFTIYTSAMP